MKKIISLLLVLVFSLALMGTASAAGGNVTYIGDAGEFVFEPGSEYSPTDLFPNFKDVMPGDTVAQRITVRNDASKAVNVKLYVRALGAHADSVDFLSQLGMTVQLEKGGATQMFDAQADKTAQLTDWVCLGQFASGEEAQLLVTLQVPVELDNRYQAQIGYLDWQFMVEEYPVPSDTPETGDNAALLLPLTAGAVSAVLLLCLRRKNTREG